MRGRLLTATTALALAIGLLGGSAGAAKAAAIRDAQADCSARTSCVITWAGAQDVDVFAGTAVDDIDTSTPVATAEGATTVTVDGLDPASRYYFELVSDGAKHGTVVADRSLHLESAPNARDIGGYETEDSHHVKWGTVFRSDALSKATAADQAALTALGIKVVCDYRGPSEVEADGADQLPPGAELLSAPVYDEDNDLSDKIRTAITSGDAAQQEALLGGGRGEKVLTDAGKTFVDDPDAREQFAAVMERLADDASLPALQHCTAGKDRTGWSTAVILSALGVPRETIIEDYLATNDYTKAKNESTLQSVANLMENPELLRPVLEVREEYIQSSFDEVEKKYGTMDKYLRKGLGLTKAQIAALRENLLTD